MQGLLYLKDYEIVDNSPKYIIKLIDDNYTATTEDLILLSPKNDITVTLPEPIDGKIFNFKIIVNNTFTVTLKSDKNIDGNDTYKFSTVNGILNTGCVSVIGYNNTWYLMNIA